MYHTKSKNDYMNRYQKTGQKDMFQAQTPMSYNATMGHSSSSPETSPDSFPDLTAHQFPPEFRSQEARPELFKDFNRESEYQHRLRYTESFQPRNSYQDQIRQDMAFEPHIRPFAGQIHPERQFGNPQTVPNNFVLAEHIYETPITRRQRPIIGRKITMNPDPLETINESPWISDMAHTPPKSIEQKYIKNYELFQSDNRGFEFPSPVKSPHTSPLIGTPPRIPMTPRTSTPVTTPPRSPFSPRMSTPFKEPLIGPNMTFTTNYGASKMCTFCRKNGETPLVYMTHMVKEKVGNKNVVTCPILRSHVCSMCGATGDNSHTITYCPVLRSGNNGQPLQSTTITLKNTRVKSNGRRRY